VRGGDGLANMLVLLVEDDPDLSEVAQYFLESAGMLVLHVRDGEHALRVLEHLRPNVIVLDMMMPVMDGFAFLKEYQSGRADRAPVLAISAFAPYGKRAREQGADAFLGKPFEPQQLVDMIEAVVGGRAPADRLISPELEAYEERRLGAILDLRLDQPAPEPALREFVEDVARHFGVAVALVSIITEEQQYWTAACGLPSDLDEARGTPRRESFCTHAVAARAALVVQDTEENPFFRDNPLVQQRGLRFYAGVPLIARHGEALGTLCLLDFAPRTFRYTDMELLGVFGRRVLAAFEHRERLAGAEIPDSAFRFLNYVDQELDLFGQQAFRELTVVEAARASELDLPAACVVLAAPYRRLAAIATALRARSPQGLVGRLGHARLGWIVLGMAAPDARAVALEEAGPHAFAAATELQRYPGAALAELDRLEMDLGDAGLA
jgi:DNA-binding response OmpR family regulator